MSVEIKEPSGFFGADLVATSKGFKLSLYLPGPDSRYNGEWFTVAETGIDGLIREYEEAFEQYNGFVAAKIGAEVQKILGRLSVRHGGYSSGVCIGHYHHPVSGQTQLYSVLSSLRRAKARGPELVAAAKLLD